MDGKIGIAGSRTGLHKKKTCLLFCNKIWWGARKEGFGNRQSAAGNRDRPPVSVSERAFFPPNVQSGHSKHPNWGQSAVDKELEPNLAHDGTGLRQRLASQRVANMEESSAFWPEDSASRPSNTRSAPEALSHYTKP